MIGALKKIPKIKKASRIKMVGFEPITRFWVGIHKTSIANS
jgi:hypothetical protein